MARTIPSSTSGRVTPSPAPAAGGGGVNAWKPWVTLPNDPTDGWTVTTGSGATAIGATVAKVGDELRFKAPSSVGMICQGASMKGIFMARSIHLKPWIQAGIPMPEGQVENQCQWESMQLKIEVEFASASGGPISGGDVVGAEGTNLTCLAGLAGFATDQSGSPDWASGVIWSAAQVFKSLGGDPAAATSPNMYKAGYKSYFTNAGIQQGYTWKNMSNPPAGAHNALVYATVPLRKENTTGRTSIQAGSYANDVPFLPMATLGQQLFDNTLKFSNTTLTPFWHIFLSFGTDTNTAGKGEIRIKKIRYCLQPIVGRTVLE